MSNEEGPRASTFTGDPKSMRKFARRAAAISGAEGAVLLLVNDGGIHIGCTASLEWCGEVLEKALNDWRGAATDVERGHETLPSAPIVVPAKTIPKLAALTALTMPKKTTP